MYFKQKVITKLKSHINIYKKANILKAYTVGINIVRHNFEITYTTVYK